MPEYTPLQKEYAQYRINRAKEDLDAAHLLFDTGNYRIANNRAYYAIFHALRAVLVFDNFDSSKQGIFPTEMSKMIGSAFTIRNASDYDDMFIASRDDTEEQIANAEYIYKLLRTYISNITNQA